MLCLLIGGQSMAQEVEQPVLLPDSAWDQPLPIFPLDIRLLDVTQLRVLLADILALGISGLTIDSLRTTALEWSGLAIEQLDIDALGLTELRVLVARLQMLVFAEWPEKKLTMPQLRILLADIRVLPLDALAIAQLREEGWLLVLEGAYEDGMAMWERRYDAVLDYVTTSGLRVLPSSASPLGMLRAEVMKRIEQDGTNWSDETEVAWINYHHQVGEALNRRVVMKARRDARRHREVGKQ
jgi:hypothetical protein